MKKTETEDIFFSPRKVEFKDMMDLQKELKRFEGVRIGRRLFSAFDQYLHEKKIIGITTEGEVVVFNPTEYNFFLQVDQELKRYELKDLPDSTPKYTFYRKELKKMPITSEMEF